MALPGFHHPAVWVGIMRQSLTALFLAGALGIAAGSALADDNSSQPSKLTPVKPTTQAAGTLPKAAAPPNPDDNPPVVVNVTKPAGAQPPAPASSAAPQPATAATVAAPAPGPKPAVISAAPLPPAPSCLPEIAKAERRYKIPDGLLVAIALTESGRRDEETGIFTPWPWTINSHGQGAYFDTVDAAAAKTAEMLAQNNGLVDVGCMQVDLYHHPHAFQTLLAAFDPETNVDYAAQFLTELKAKNGSWFAAVAAYNAGIPELGAEYVARVLYYWKGLKTSEATVQIAGEGTAQRRGYIIEAKPSPLEIAADFVEKKEYPAATTIYRAVLRDNPDDQTAMLGLAKTLRDTGQPDQARGQLERVLTENPNNAEALVTLLGIIDDTPEPQRMTALLSARQVAPNSAQIPARIAMLEGARGRTAEAIAQMGSAVRLAPDDPIFQLNYALMLDRGGYRMASLDAYGKFLKMYRSGTTTVALTVSVDQIRQRMNYLRSSAP